MANLRPHQLTLEDEIEAAERKVARKARMRKAAQQKAERILARRATREEAALAEGKILPRREAKTHKICARCKKLKPIEEFGRLHGILHAAAHGLNPNERQGYCNECKATSQSKSRLTNVILRVRHHTLTRVMRQLEPKPPEDIQRSLEKYLGYPLQKLKTHIAQDLHAREQITPQEAFRKGYHLDHIVPLHSFAARIQDTTLQDPASLQAFRECWHYTNLRLISQEENLAKGGKM